MTSESTLVETLDRIALQQQKDQSPASLPYTIGKLRDVTEIADTRSQDHPMAGIDISVIHPLAGP